ncbi:ATP-binding cassette domain-containing protein [Chlorobium sp. BLA1]|uniref:ABC transporter ATP-binding protein n=1 Tax=Candidatus Chlorobium masyuteum TaxID=2716876 RepID=UPI00141F7FFA|nr:ABC transporter ATP-binding protein [Candidatus Chlorobium masyuteum]NHQ61122.1 ATP-binding cassette domain-containing protein [Candidatus Chlorobium masyuteum]
MKPLLEIRNLSFGYEGSQSPVFESLDLTVQAGDFILVKGASGSGKSTLLRLICRLNRPNGGNILFQGSDIGSVAPAKLRSIISYVAQIPQMVDASVEENLLLPFSFAANASKSPPRRDELRAMLRKFYLAEVTPDQSALKLSVGQKQRLAIMRSLLQDPLLLLLDEPTSALDRESASMVFSIMEHLNVKEGKTMITVTHTDYKPEKVQPLNYMLDQRRLHLLP